MGQKTLIQEILRQTLRGLFRQHQSCQTALLKTSYPPFKTWQSRMKESRALVSWSVLSVGQQSKLLRTGNYLVLLHIHDPFKGHRVICPVQCPVIVIWYFLETKLPRYLPHWKFAEKKTKYYKIITNNVVRHFYAKSIFYIIIVQFCQYRDICPVNVFSCDNRSRQWIMYSNASLLTQVILYFSSNNALWKFWLDRKTELTNGYRHRHGQDRVKIIDDKQTLKFYQCQCKMENLVTSLHRAGTDGITIQNVYNTFQGIVVPGHWSGN